MEITIKINRRSKQAKAFYEYIKNPPFVEVGDIPEKPETKSAWEEIMKISKEINRAGAKNWFEKLGIDYDSYSGQ